MAVRKLPLASGLSQPLGVAVDGAGDVFVAEDGTNIILQLQRSQAPTLSFPNTNVGSSSSPQSVTLENIGNAPLTFPTPGAGYNPSIAANFTYDNSSTCEQLSPSSAPTALAPGGSCTLAIDFAPTVPGSVTGSAVETDNNLNVANSTQSIPLSGNATQTLVSFGVTGLVNAVANTGQNLTITAYDADGNVDTAYNGTVRVSTSDPNAGVGTLTISIASGQKTLNGVLKLITAGSQTVTATDTATSIAGTSAPITISAGAAYNVAVVQGDTQSATVNTAFPASLQALVSDRYSNPVSGTTVTFTVPASGASATVSTAAATGADGTTSVTATANATSGSYLVRASVLGLHSVNFHLTNNAASQTITFAPLQGSVVYGSAPITLSATSSSNLAVTFSVLSGPATVNATTLTITGVGRVVVAADQAGNSTYAAATEVTQTFQVTGAAPAISFMVGNQTYGAAPFAVAATSNSAGAITYSVVSGPATVNGATVTLTGAGTVVLQASQAANGNYAAGSQNATFTVSAATPTISFAVGNQTYGAAPFAVAATSNSAGAFTYSVVSGPAAVNGSTVTLTGAGTVVLQASQPANGNYAAGSQNATFTVSAAAPAISFMVGNQTYGAAPFAVAATSNSAGAITYSVVSGPATVNGATVTLTGAGTVVLQASQAANGNYAAGSQNATFTVSAAAPAISFTVGNQTYGAAPFAVAATSNSAGAITYSVVSGPATVNGATVTLTGAGTVVLQASQAANGNYSAGSQNATFTVSAAAPAVSFTVGNQTYGAAPFAVAATSNSAGAITYSVVSGPATVNGATVTLTGAGTVILQASQAANGNYAAGSQNATFTVTAAAPAISFMVGNQTYGAAPFAVAATSNSAGAITYSVVSGPATVNGATVTLTGAGTVVLQASQAANGNYAAGIKTSTFTVTAPLTSVSLQVADTTLVYPLPPLFEVSIALNGKVAPTGSVQILDGSTVLGTYPVLGFLNGHVFGLVPPESVGQHVLKAIYSGDKNYPSGSSATVTVTVVPGPVRLGLNCGSSATLQYGQSLNCTVGASEAILPVSGTVTYTVTGAMGGSSTLNPLGQASIQITQLSRGSHTLTVSYAAQGNYQAAAPVSVTITVN
ncbi:MAG TPA: Ig-like domain repeat protein [Acidisarcina sp.]